MSWLCPRFCKRHVGSYELGGFQGVQGIQYVEKKPSLSKQPVLAKGNLPDRESGIETDITQEFITQNISSTTQFDLQPTKIKDKAPKLPTPQPPRVSLPSPPILPPAKANAPKPPTPQPQQATLHSTPILSPAKDSAPKPPTPQAVKNTAPQPPASQYNGFVAAVQDAHISATVLPPEPQKRLIVVDNENVHTSIAVKSTATTQIPYEEIHVALADNKIVKQQATDVHIREPQVVSVLYEESPKPPKVKFGEISTMTAYTETETRPPAPIPTENVQISKSQTSAPPEPIYSDNSENLNDKPPAISNGDLRMPTDQGSVTNMLNDAPNEVNLKRPGVKSEPIEEHTLKDVIETFEKDDKSKELIKLAISKNDFLNNMMDDKRLEAVTSAMYSQQYQPDQFIIQEGQTGSHVYVSAEGKFDVLKNNVVISSFGVGVAFGELAILYKAKRFASIRATAPAKVWILQRKVFQKIMMKTGRLERQENLNFLRSVKALKGLSEEKLTQVADLLRREFHAAGSPIITQGADGDKFYIIRAGTVNVVKRDLQAQEHLVNTLNRGDYFGEQALLHSEKRLATVIAQAPGTECLTLDRIAFEKYLGPLDTINKPPPLSPRTSRPIKSKSAAVFNSDYAHIKLKDLEIVGTLGVGGFGRVELVKYKKSNETFALKYLKKVEMVKQQHQQHVYSEKDIMASCDSPFIIKLYNTYRDAKYLYFLMEACLGGDVWTVLQSNKHFDEVVGRFMTACVIEALEYMHTRNMVYRDLKPENLMLDQKGYVKLVDFGFAKRVDPPQHTWTFAGTPEYVAPEIILNKGHDRAVDYWALGVLIHELLVGKPPFRGKDHMKTYSLILRGIDVIQMSTRIPKKAQDLIKKLCRQIPTERLGYAKGGISDIKAHTWFHGIDWDKLRKQSMSAPLVRKVKSNTDLSNFEPYPRDEDDPPDENSGWDINF